MIHVLPALADYPTRWRYGDDLGNQVGLKPGSLDRLTTAGVAVLAAIPAISAAPPALGLPRRGGEVGSGLGRPDLLLLIADGAAASRHPIP
jgi:hypothetical protein